MPDLIEPPAPEVVDTPPPAPEPGFLETLAKDLGEGKFDDRGNLKVAPEPPAPKPLEEKKEDPKEPETPPVVEKKDDDTPEPPASLSEKAKADWEGIRGTARNYKAKVEAAEKAMEAKEKEWAEKEAEWQQKLEEASAASGELVELRGRKEAFEANEKEWATYSVERTKEFQDTISKPLGAIEDRLRAIAAKPAVKEAGVSFDDLADAVAEMDDTRQSDLLEALLVNLGGVDGAKVVRMAEDTRGLLTRRAEILENAHAAQKEIKERSEKEATAAKEADSKAYKASVKNTVESIAARMPFVPLAEGETKEGVIKSILDKAEAEDFDKSTPATKGTAAVSVIVVERLLRQAQNQEDYIKTLEARVAEGNKSAPSVQGDTPPPAPPKQEGGLMDGVNALLGLQKSRPVAPMEKF